MFMETLISVSCQNKVKHKYIYIVWKVEATKFHTTFLSNNTDRRKSTAFLKFRSFARLSFW
jgi:hypothetical protein